MFKKITIFMLTLCLMVGSTGCVVDTGGDASWEFYGGIRTKQISKAPAKVEIQSTVIDKIVDMFTDDKVTDAE